MCETTCRDKGSARSKNSCDLLKTALERVNILPSIIANHDNVVYRVGYIQSNRVPVLYWIILCPPASVRYILSAEEVGIAAAQDHRSARQGLSRIDTQLG